ncbi:hypothetical protein GF415_01890 [Candidatus Micrarchaeota archaeon]|nr:hypothetical protein [Candidatus Micrarchaeota archaeon]
MVLGIGEGKMDLELNSYDVTLGGEISGKLVLELNSPKNAKELRVELVGEQWQTRRGKRKKVGVYQYKEVLGGEKEYTSGEYLFQLQAPVKTGIEKKAEEGVAGAVLGAAKLLGAVSPVEYYVIGTLNLPMSLDINKKVQIAVR